MKSEIYSCFKMLQAFNKSCIDAFNSGAFESAFGLCGQYNQIIENLKQYLDFNQIKFVPIVHPSPSDGMYPGALLHKLSSASGLLISYIRSTESNLDKELLQKVMELDKKEKELELKEKEIESLKKLLKKSIEAINELPEVFRSGAIADWKKNHRDIEEYSRKNKNEKS